MAALTKKRKLKEKTDEETKTIPLIIDQKIDEDDLLDSHDIASDTSVHGAIQSRLIFQWLLSPLSIDAFYKDYYEQHPLVIKRDIADYYDKWFSEAELRRILTEHSLEYGDELDVTRYANSVRSNWQPSNSTTADSRKVWSQYEKGYSIRLLCPQKYCDPLWKLLAVLEAKFGSMVGCNIYMTPPGAQGFAPHYDDIEAFILQVEGKKHWQIYAPLDEETTLPRYSSKNFSQEEIGSPVLEIELEPGDMLYMPRGFIHQARSALDIHSLHLTISANQHNAYGDFLELLLPQALQSAIKKHVSLRRSLSWDYQSYMGVMHSDREDDTARKSFIKKMKTFVKIVTTEAVEMVDAASDQMAKAYISDRLPPVLEENEVDCTVEGFPNLKITVDTQMKVVRYDVARLVVEDGKAILYHCMDNSRKHHENALSPLEFELDDAETLEFILQSYPEYFRVGDLPQEDAEDQIGVAKALYDEGILCFQNVISD